MPQDKNGNSLAIGDLVTIHGRVVAVSPLADFSNLTVETIEPMYPGNRPVALSLNTRQVERVAKALMPAAEYAKLWDGDRESGIYRDWLTALGVGDVVCLHNFTTNRVRVRVVERVMEQGALPFVGVAVDGYMCWFARHCGISGAGHQILPWTPDDEPMVTGPPPVADAATDVDV